MENISSFKRFYTSLEVSRISSINSMRLRGCFSDCFCWVWWLTAWRFDHRSNTVKLGYQWIAWGMETIWTRVPWVLGNLTKVCHEITMRVEGLSREWGPEVGFVCNVGHSFFTFQSYFHVICGMSEGMVVNTQVGCLPYHDGRNPSCRLLQESSLGWFSAGISVLDLRSSKFSGTQWSVRGFFG